MSHDLYSIVVKIDDIGSAPRILRDLALRVETMLATHRIDCTSYGWDMGHSGDPLNDNLKFRFFVTSEHRLTAGIEEQMKDSIQRLHESRRHPIP